MAEVSQFSLKYRPLKWNDIYGQDPVVNSLKKRLKQDNIPSCVLFSGPYGTGKTTIAQLFAACLVSPTLDDDLNPDWNSPSCKSILNNTFDRDVQRLDGAQWSGKSDVIDFMKDIKLKPLYDKRKVILIEEADAISSAGISSLLKILESLPPYVTIILLSMDTQKGLPPAIKSRCQVFNVKSLGIKDMMLGLKNILDKESVWKDSIIPREFKFEGLKTIATSAKGSMRTAVQNLEKCLVNEAYTSVDIENLIDEVGELAIWRILDGLLSKSKEDSLWRSIMKYKGEEISHLYQYMIMLLSEAVLYKETGFIYDENAKFRLGPMGNNPNSESLLYTLTLHPQLNKPFIRNSDLIGALVGYYQGIDLRPNSIKTENKITIGDKNFDIEKILPTPTIKTRIKKEKINE